MTALLRVLRLRVLAEERTQIDNLLVAARLRSGVSGHC